LISGIDPEKLSELIYLKATDTLYFPKGLYDNRNWDTLKTFYNQNHGQPVWLSHLKDSSFRESLLAAVKSVREHGLKTKYYNLQALEAALIRYKSLRQIKSDDDYQFLSDLEFLVSISIVNVYHDLALGRINPFAFYKPFYSVPFTKGQNFNLFAVLNNPVAFQDSIYLRTPASVRYHTLQEIYNRQYNYINSNTILDYDTSQDLNSDHNFTVVNQRLDLLWLNNDKTNPVTSREILKNRNLYIQKTRKIFGLPEGEIDSIFIDRICIPKSELLYEVLVALERERWFSQPDTGTYLVVNLPEFNIYMHHDSIQQMKVCVGKKKSDNYDQQYRDYIKSGNYRSKPINSETPQIGSRITQVILNPTWTVPNSIIGKEMYAQIVANPAYLTRKGYEVLLDGKVVSPGSINWKAYKPYSVPVKIRQKAGPSNSLGKLKFNFPNPHNIYLHDTPEKGKFSQNNRAVSHGCVRLNYPEEMAEFILSKQHDSLIVDKFRLKMGLQPYDSALQKPDSLLKPIKTTEIINLKHPIPIYLDYKTLVIERNGDIRYLKDIYRRNKALGKKLSE
jgi:murein L,D-transpeptidase YcbB/YkuD